MNELGYQCSWRQPMDSLTRCLMWIILHASRVGLPDRGEGCPSAMGKRECSGPCLAQRFRVALQKPRQQRWGRARDGHCRDDVGRGGAVRWGGGRPLTHDDADRDAYTFPERVNRMMILT
eukprot:938630-Pleurochrysis_carterae.AAC.1